MTAVLPEGLSSATVVPTGAGRALARRVGTRAELTRLAVTGAVASAAVAVITWQQLDHTPWGMPGHRAVFWLSTLIAARLIIDRPGSAVRVAAGSSGLILVIAPATGGQVVPYLVAALLIDRAAATRAIGRQPWLLLPLAPLMGVAGVVSPLVRNLAISPLGTALPGMWFYIQGYLLWGVAAGAVGLAAGLSGR